MQRKLLKGISIAEGVALGKARKIMTNNNIISDDIFSIEDENKRFLDSIADVNKELNKLIKKAEKDLGNEQAGIFMAQLAILNDPDLLKDIKIRISLGISLNKAIKDVFSLYENYLRNSNNCYINERTADLKDVYLRLTESLDNHRYDDIKDDGVVLLVQELMPSDTMHLNLNRVKAIVSEKGGLTGHAAIIARSIGIPYVSGINDLLNIIDNGSEIYVNAYQGEIIINPNEKDYGEIKNELLKHAKESEILITFNDKKAFSKDNKEIKLCANVGSIDDLNKLKKINADGIGLFRSEFFYLGREKAPSEDEQFQIYKKALESTPQKEVIIRTLDIGGDKKLSYLPIEEELNPYLGYRAIRISLQEEKLFRRQLRALLRASVYGKLSIMFPLIADLNEFLKAKEIVKEEEKKLKEKDYKVSNYRLGIMIETPIAAIHAGVLAGYCDFFSIGTNDLIQYSFASDRLSSKTNYLYQPLHPAFLRMLKIIIDGAHLAGIECSMCGEMSSDPLALPILLGLGLDELSMNPDMILKIKKELCTISYADAKLIAQSALVLEDEQAVIKLLNSYNYDRTNAILTK